MYPHLTKIHELQDSLIPNLSSTYDKALIGKIITYSIKYKAWRTILGM